MKKIISLKIMSLLLTSTFSLMAQAAGADFAVEGGFRQQSGDYPQSTVSTRSQNGFQVGATASFPVAENIYFRTGMLYTQRPLVLEDTTNSDEIKTSLGYLDIPITVMYKFEDYGGLFAGFSLANQFDSSCSTSTSSKCKLTSVKTPITPLIFGASLKFLPQMGVTLYYETMGGSVATLSETQQNLENYRAVGLNLFMTFE